MESAMVAGWHTARLVEEIDKWRSLIETLESERMLGETPFLLRPRYHTEARIDDLRCRLANLELELAEIELEAPHPDA
jgi:hypothetical protein